MADKFVKITKDGETIEVSPLVVEDHKRLGWKVVEESQAEKPKAEKPKAEKPKAEKPADDPEKAKK